MEKKCFLNHRLKKWYTSVLNKTKKISHLTTENISERGGMTYIEWKTSQKKDSVPLNA